ncbi:MAG: carbonic anhydrase [Proteobacteria bacterium]|nr:MAG: carbonic anhydrase [Pseudomonadota bacterium]
MSNVQLDPQTPTPAEALARLQEGNRRFVSGFRSVEPLLSHLKMRELAENGQRPFAIVLTCSDSRSPAEMIFDQGLGDLFVVRVAGNVVAPSLLASIEFAAANFGSSLVLVLGHTKCGAVGATVKNALEPQIPLPSTHLENLVGKIMPAVKFTQTQMSTDSPEFLDSATIENVKRSCSMILDDSHIIKDLATTGKLTVEGALLDISTGEVRFLNGIHQ